MFNDLLDFGPIYPSPTYKYMRIKAAFSRPWFQAHLQSFPKTLARHRIGPVRFSVCVNIIQSCFSTSNNLTKSVLVLSLFNRQIFRSFSRFFSVWTFHHTWRQTFCVQFLSLWIFISVEMIDKFWLLCVSLLCKPWIYINPIMNRKLYVDIYS